MASCTSTGRRFALKALQVSAKVSQKKIDAEIKNMERVKGLPCVIQSVGVIKSPGCSFILMPLAHGSLRDEVNKWSSPRLSEGDLRKVARPILVGIAGMHSRNIIHCDIKEHNVLLMGPLEEGKGMPGLCVADVGCSEVVGREGRRAGTEGYAAPEVVKGQPYGLHADLFSYGAMIYKLFYKTLPFENGGWDEALSFPPVG